MSNSSITGYQPGPASHVIASYLYRGRIVKFYIPRFRFYTNYMQVIAFLFL